MIILIPMAGEGQRFRAAGYTKPKPLINVLGEPMIKRVMDNIGYCGYYVLIAQLDHAAELREVLPDTSVVWINEKTSGAACTTLAAEKYINTSESLLIANCDQLVDNLGMAFMENWARCEEADGFLVTFCSQSPNHSYCKLDNRGWVTHVAEKDPVSHHANVGMYWWKHGSDYVEYCRQMIKKDIRTNGEFFICPVYNEAIADGKKILTCSVDGMHCLGTPEDLEAYVRDTMQV